MINRGSEWARWDLHIHTKGTAKNDQFTSPSLEEFFQLFFLRAIENEIKVIGITDYFNIENYKKAIEYQKDINLKDFFNAEQKEKIQKITIIPNMELRITPTTGRGTLINIHILFNPSILEDFEELFLTQANMVVGESQRFSLTRRGLIGLGKHHYHDISNDNEAYKKGIEQFSLTHKDLVEILEKNKILKENCLIFVANSTNDGASGIKSHEEYLAQQQASASELRNSIYRISDGLFSPKPSDLKYFLGKGADSVEEIIRKYGALKPCIHGCDAHTESKLFKPDNNQYCWIKAEPTFEGLKQILHEPETRVHIGPVAPELKNDYEVIDHIKLQSDNVFNNIIYFNPNLTSIIGGRSSGKSTLLQCLAKKLRPTALEEDSNHLNELCQNLEIIWKDGNQDDSRQIEYFYQGHMYKKSKDEGVEQIVKKLLLQQNPNLFDSFDKEKSASKLKIAGELSTYFSTKEQIEQKKSSLLTMGKIEDVNAQIQALSEQINAFQTEDIAEQELRDHDVQKAQINSHDNEIEQINNLVDCLNKITINDLISTHNPFKTFQAYPTVSENFEQAISSIESFAGAQIANLIKNANELLHTSLTEATQERNAIQSEPQFIKVLQFLSQSENLKPILFQKQQEETKARRITQIHNDIEELESSNALLLASVRQEWLTILASYCEVIESINAFQVSEDLEIISSKIFEVDSFQTWIKNCINQQSDKAQSFTNQSISTSEELLALFDTITQSLTDASIKFKQGNTLENFTKEFFDNTWFRLKYDVIYDGDNYNAMSQGKKAFVVLKMTLDCSDSSCPIIIDQPEDDLDNRAIFTELVTYLKDKKTQRQIILVTHNANVVVNADSELVIIANQHGSHSPNNNNKKFQYKYGSIECLLQDHDPRASTLDKKRIKDHICEILEGGDKAFKLREKKYNFM
ncbi:TrlF family AAA-like ATPase [Acinetobacter rudis]|uniref:DNA repair protein n=1 Tax=Acinetobacter rudis TaxID=632955 RepID=A0AAW8JDY2_9GAMM|nr:hypothetical protein [Acinetobacter rudis]MDQ8936876.1 hypothetical protein [Acinetobacter rudis]MDQ9019102.1 hypothetical protein [Acinetobacter rudis]